VGCRNLIQWLHVKGQNPAVNGYTYLATVLVTFLGKWGPDQSKSVIGVLERYRLVSQNELIEELRQRYLTGADG
jgi:hypothetical protein